MGCTPLRIPPHEADAGVPAHAHTRAYAHTMVGGAPASGLQMGASVPDHFLDPLSGSLMLEPVTLMNSGVTLDRLTLQAWLHDGAPPQSAIHCLPRPGQLAGVGPAQGPCSAALPASSLHSAACAESRHDQVPRQQG